jgi:hypothetical protein
LNGFAILPNVVGAASVMILVVIAVIRADVLAGVEAVAIVMGSVTYCTYY